MPPGRFLSDAEIERLGAFPEQIERGDVVRFFSPAGEDLTFVRMQRGAPNQLGIALQLGALRWLGFVPEDLTAAPAEVLAALGSALDIPPRTIFDYAVRAPTRVEHRLLVRAHADFRAFIERDLDHIRAQMVEIALEHERPSLLLARLCELMRAERIERPSIDRLVRLVGSARERAHEQTFERLAPQLTDPIREKLDGLLVAGDGKSAHAWLRSRPTSVSGRALGRELQKRTFLLELGVERFDLSRLPPNRRAWLAQAGRQQTNQALARLTPERRYPVLAAFCVEALERVTDDAIEVFDRALGTADRAAQRKREELERHGRRDIQSTVRRFIDLSGVVLEAHDSGTDVIRLIERRIGIDQLRADLDRAQGIARPADTGHIDLLITDSGAAGRKLLAAVIASLRLRPAGVDEDELLAALRLIGQLADDKRRWLPGFSPSAFIDTKWRAHVVDTSRGRFDRRAFELCAAYELRTALRAGRVWVPGSRRHADPSNLLLPDDQWNAARFEFTRAVEQPVDGNQRLDALAREQAELLKRLAHERDTTSQTELTDDDADTDQDSGRLRKLIEQRLPEVDLPELLIEVDAWTGFTEHLTPLSGNRRRSSDMPCLLYAAVLAQATNLGLTGMARSSRFTYQQLEWAWEQLCRDETLTAASATLVDYHHALPLTQAWGTGRLSSSDGQRFSARTRGPGVAAQPRYFGHRRHGMQIYSWTSDQYSQYASKVVSATVRDATHTLDGILDNHTVLPIEEHTTDTHGYTEMIFGAYDLVGLHFWPWIRDLDRQQLYRHGTPPDLDTGELLRHKLRPQLITPYWDDLLRLGASLRQGWAPASLLLARLQAGSRRNPLAQALQEYGRLIKTNFILAWLGDDELRHRVRRQLNKGEQLHALRREIFYANEGHIRQRTPDQQSEQALCLAIVVNAIIAWNTVYIQRVLDQLRANGEVIATSEIEHISPLARQHIHLYGHYPFDLATRPAGHRPLRAPASASALTPETLNRV